MELLKGLELIEVNYENDNKKAVLTFLDEDRGEVREVNFNKQSYDNGKYIDDPEKAEKAEQFAEKYFSLTFNTLSQAIGEKHDIYAYDKFNSLYEVSIVEKFEDDMVGQIFETEVTEVVDDGIAVKIKFQYDGTDYESKMTYSKYQPSLKQWFVDPQKRDKQYAKFMEKFGIHVGNKETLVGKTVMVEVKKAMGKYTYAEIKPFPKKKSK